MQMIGHTDDILALSLHGNGWFGDQPFEPAFGAPVLDRVGFVGKQKTTLPQVSIEAADEVVR
jgi:hypothetical protein